MANREETKKMIEVMQAYVDGNDIEFYDTYSPEKTWETCQGSPSWLWSELDYRIAKTDPYAHLKAAAQDPTKQIRNRYPNDNWSMWHDSNFYVSFCLAPKEYEIRDKPKPTKKVKLLAWFGKDHNLRLVEEGYEDTTDLRYADLIRVPSEDKEIEVEE